MDRALLQKIKDYVLTVEIKATEYSDEFAGIYLHSNSPFILEEHRGPLHSFRAFTQKRYPLYFFISEDALTKDFDEFYDNYSFVQPIIIPRLDSIYAFNDFSINGLMQMLPENALDLIYLQEDGFLYNYGIEDFKEWDWIGALWDVPHGIISEGLDLKLTRIGNGGFNKRNKSKCLQVLDWVNKNGGQNKLIEGIYIEGRRRTYGSFVAEDMFFAGLGYGLGMFNTPSEGIVNKFSLEPITYFEFLNKKSVGFHRIDRYE